MCGILACLADIKPVILEKALCLLRMRGPDFENSIGIANDSAKLYGFVLCMQEQVQQPICSKDGNVLCFNGEMYSSLKDGACCSKSGSDTRNVLEILNRLPDGEARIRALDEEFEGEWSFVSYDAKRNSLFWCRDGFGRRSLLEGRDDSGRVVCISSVSFDPSLVWSEIPVSHGFEYNFERLETVSIERKLKWTLTTLLTLNNESSPQQLLFDALKCAVSRRVNPHTLGGNNSFAVLFSGGIDSVLIAAIAHLVSEPGVNIYLVNVSFQGEESPDRIAARMALVELDRIFPARQFSLICRDVTLEEVKSASDLIVELIRPKTSVMDFNLASVLYFASKASPSCARALLSGLGADELFGGYSRHKAALSRGGPEALKSEMALDLGRMWTRNLGRDDRAISANGKEMRTPFLDTDVVRLALSLCHLIVEGNGVEDKKLVRDLARHVGLKESAGREKRAAQFGSRMAKLVKSGRSGRMDFDISALGTDEDVACEE